jgi:hypothetical protein
MFPVPILELSVGSNKKLDVVTSGQVFQQVSQIFVLLSGMGKI